MTLSLLAEPLLAALSWDPQIRGFVIFLTAFVILPGSVYLLLATNTGAKLGFLLAAAGLTGWMATMGIVWAVFGIGMRGRDPSWHIEEVVSGDTSAATVDAMEDFPKGGWEKLKPGDAILGDAQAAADRVLLPAEDAGAHGEGGAAPEPEVRLDKAPFESAEDYIQVAGYRTGGENYWPGGIGEVDPTEPKDNVWERIKAKGFLHRPHYAVIQVAPVVEYEHTPGSPPRAPERDVTKPLTTVVMVRDLGSVRRPPMIIAFFFTLLFAIICNALHRRDKEIMALRSQAATA